MPIVAILAGLMQFAPQIAKWIGKGEDVAAAVANIATTVSGTKTPEEALAAITKSAELQQAFKIEIMKNETHLEEIYLSDTQSARDRDVKLAQSGYINRRANILAGLAILLVFTCMFITIWSALDEYAKGIITLILGRCLGWVEQIYSFEYGTTRSNKVKDDTISNLTGGK